MSHFFSVLGNIVVFLLCLSVVVCLHEAGHLLVAKCFNVYCFEYSIGFGPAIFRHRFHKRKKKTKGAQNQEEQSSDQNERSETQFSIRALPLGGYVAMAGEDANETEDGKIIPENRTLNGINHAKQLAIMLAGITVNFILAYVLFFCDFAFCPQQKADLATNEITVAQYSDTSKKEEYALYQAGLRTGDRILSVYQEYHGLLVYEGGAQSEKAETVYWPYQPSDEKPLPEIKTYQHFLVDGATSFDQSAPDALQYYVLDIFSARNQKSLTLPSELQNVFPGPSSTRLFHLTYEHVNEDGSAIKKSVTTKEIKTVAKQESKMVTTYSFGLLGISPKVVTYRYGFGESFALAGKMFGQLFTGIYQAIGTLFAPAGWQNVGGIISVYRLSASGVQSGSIGNFLLLWGYISLNLGCFNLLPLPGLDGWQSLIAIIESIIRKKLPKKFKNIANTVGLIALLALAALLVVKDLL